MLQLWDSDVDDGLHALSDTEVVHDLCRLFCECFVDLQSKSGLVLGHLKVMLYSRQIYL
jgi:hypothetical protein